MDLVSEMKRVNEQMAVLEERLARLELAQDVVQPRTTMGAHSGLVSRRVSGTGGWDARPSGNNGSGGRGLGLLRPTTKTVVSESRASISQRAIQEK